MITSSSMRSLRFCTLAGSLMPLGIGQYCVEEAIDGEQTWSWTGVEVADVGDVNADGVRDVLVGAHMADNQNGRVEVYSGADATHLLLKLCGTGGERLGWSAAGVGDLNSDGHDDFLVGAWRNSLNGQNSGAAYLVSGIDGTFICEYYGATPGGHFGWDVAGLGTASGNEKADFAISAPWGDYGGADLGSVFLYSGSTLCAPYARLDGEQPYALFGLCISGVDDLTEDGRPDLAVGDPFYTYQGLAEAGRVQIFDVLKPTSTHVAHGIAPGNRLGWSIDDAGDLDGDTKNEVLVGAPYTDHGGQVDSGVVHAYKGSNFAHLWARGGSTAEDRLGFSVAGAGDIDGDGTLEVLAGAPGDDDSNGASPGYVMVLEGDFTSYSLIFGSHPGEAFGRAVGSADDLDGDGIPEFMIGAPFHTEAGQNLGSAYVMTLCGSLGIRYCSPGVPNSTGLPAVIHASGSEIVADNDFLLRAIQVPPNMFGMLINSDTQGLVNNPGGSQGVLCLGGAIGRHTSQIVNSGSHGTFLVDVDLTMVPRPGGLTAIAPGETWNWQFWHRDVNPELTSNFTDATSVAFK